jgi:hypothetical protein
VSGNEQRDQPLDYKIDWSVDSRAYSFAYLIHEPSQLAADFLVDEEFEYTLFLPQDLVPRFEQPRYVPRLLLLTAQDLVVCSHSTCGASKARIPFTGISHIELERFLASCSLIILTPGRHYPFAVSWPRLGVCKELRTGSQTAPLCRRIGSWADIGAETLRRGT